MLPGRSAVSSRPPAVDLAASVRSLPSLTGLRWVAALAVFAFHVRNANLVEGPLQDVLSRSFGVGAVGVSLFFVLSGFVLTWADRPGGSARTFWWRRVARIYPLHVLAVLLAIVLGHTIARGKIFADDPVALLANLLLVNTWSVDWNQAGNLVSWTLGCEAFFYLLFPAIVPLVRAASPRALRAALAVALIVVVALPLASAAFPVWLDYHTSPVARLPEFVVGIVASRLTRTGAWRGPGVGLSLVLTGAGYALARYVPVPVDLAACTIVGFACLIPALALRDASGRGSWLAARWSVWLGEVSFAFYLVHLLIIQAAGSAWPGGEPRLGTAPGALLVLAVLCVCVGAAWLLHVGVERPAQRALTARRVR
jgi:peptidoglycan/LPS O-acetylase OafA/YrhL